MMTRVWARRSEGKWRGFTERGLRIRLQALARLFFGCMSNLRGKAEDLIGK